MRRQLRIFVLILTAVLLAAYTYISLRITAEVWVRLLIALPFIAVWLVPIVFWNYRSGDDEDGSAFSRIGRYVGYVCMGWLSFLLVLTIARDVILFAALPFGPDSLPLLRGETGGTVVFLASLSAFIYGWICAMTGPSVRNVTINFADLPPALVGLKIAQISDLHVGPTISERYVRRVVKITNGLNADFVALTGDIADGPIAAFEPNAAPLNELQPAGKIFFILGNHEYYAGVTEWTAYFRKIGMRPLLNQYAVVTHGGAKVMVAGVLDPAGAHGRGRDGETDGPDAELAKRNGETPETPQGPCDFHVLLAHNPKLTPLGAAAGFDLQLSGHTHAGQFFPWNFVAKAVHAPHFAGLSRDGKMQIYVSAGTGSWGPPIRLGTVAEVTLITLARG